MDNPPPKAKSSNRLLQRLKSYRSTASRPPPDPSMPVAAEIPVASPPAPSSPASSQHDAVSGSAPTLSGPQKAWSTFKGAVTRRRARPGAAVPSAAIPSLAAQPPNAPTSPPPEVLPSSPPVSPEAGSIPSGDPSVVSGAKKTRALSPPEQAAQALERGGQLNARAAETIEHVPGALDALSSAAESYGDVLAKIGVLVTILDKIGELHPYLKAATSILNLAVKPIIEQVARDEKFQELLEQMALVYDLVTAEFDDVTQRNEQPATRQMKLLQNISVKSQECAEFIKEEQTKSFAKRVAKNLLKGGDVDDKIDHYKSAFSTLHTKWQDEKARYDKAMQMIDKLPRVSLAGHPSQEACLENTRTAVLKEIAEWIDKPQSSRVLFVLGVAGSGKSTIAHTVSEACEDRLELGSFFAFDDKDAARTPQRLLGTIAYNLAHWDEGYRDQLVRILNGVQKHAESPNIQEQWNRLIVRPAASISSPGRVLVVIDAFDECPESKDKYHLLDCLTRHAADLPDRIRVLVTSRPLPKVSQAVTADFVSLCDLANFPAAEDIRAYVLSQLLEKGLSESRCNELARASDGLFQWAATACAFLLDGLELTTLPQKFEDYRSELVHGMSGTAEDSDRPPGPSLDDLYKTVLRAAFFLDSRKPTARAAALAIFRSTVAVMLCAQTPLSIDILQSIYDKALPTRKGKVGPVLGSMGVVLEGASSIDIPLRPMHLTFREFLLDESRSDPWHISKADIAHGHRILALGGLRIMASDLRFNMHSLPSSLSSVREEGQKEPCPHPTLAYITLNLRTHLREVLSWGLRDRNCNIFRGAWRRLLYKKLLFWMEWSLIRDQWHGLQVVRNEWDDIGTTLKLAQQMLMGKDRRFAEDVTHFHNHFGCIDYFRPPHVYLSGLAFAPAKSLVRQHFMPQFRGIPTVRPLRDSWEEIKKAPWSIKNPCLAWSTDCRYIRENGRVPSRCWNAQTGDPLDVPPNVDWRYTSLESSDGRVKVTLSLVGKELVANVERSLIACPANTTPVRFTIETGSYGDDYIADVSPDGNWLVVVDSECDLRLWDLGTGLQAWVPHATTEGQLAAIFSPDSREIVSSGIWDNAHYIFPIDKETDDVVIRPIRWPRWVNVNFKPQAQIDANGEKFPDAHLRCTKPDIHCPAAEYYHLICQPGVRLVLGGLTVDYADACYGTEWTRCYAGTLEAEESEDEYAGVDVEMEESKVESSDAEGEEDD